MISFCCSRFGTLLKGYNEMTNNEKLKCRIRECGYTINAFCKAINLSRPALLLRLRGKREFKISEIRIISELLFLSKKEVEYYFFDNKVPVLETQEMGK